METKDITSYKSTLVVLASILSLLCLNLFLAIVIESNWNIIAILIIASAQVFLVLSEFMHLRHSSTTLKLMVGMVLLLIVVVLIVTFFDYSFR